MSEPIKEKRVLSRPLKVYHNTSGYAEVGEVELHRPSLLTPHMKPQIARFKKALAALDVAESALNKVVSKRLRKCNCIFGLQELAGQMPSHYKGTRRVYEKMETLSEREYKNKAKHL